ncbi:hypothetical protein ACIBEA_44540 [Streptomyces sp. NPDC051555]|uniref:hypothetical protein n=1 Tax=Streptomyces sp. NPDC051555 TaxID=3365657 RepID=UPI00379BD8CE
MGSLLGRLSGREVAARERVAELREEIGRLNQLLAVEEERLERLTIARETVLEVLEGPDRPEDLPAAALRAGLAGVRVGDEAVAAALHGDGPVAQAAAPAERASGRQGPVTVPEWREGTDVSVLPDVYQRILAVLAVSGQPWRAKELTAKLNGGEIEPRHIETTRSKLKRLVERGWLDEAAPGLFGLEHDLRG